VAGVVVFGTTLGTTGETALVQQGHLHGHGVA
jgi:hypothetical protein